jgi:hypothetical protein
MLLSDLISINYKLWYDALDGSLHEMIGLLNYISKWISSLNFNYDLIKSISNIKITFLP